MLTYRCVYDCHNNFHYFGFITLSTPFSIFMLALPVFFCCDGGFLFVCFLINLVKFLFGSFSGV